MHDLLLRENNRTHDAPDFIKEKHVLMWRVGGKDQGGSGFFTHAHFPVRNDSPHQGGPRVALKIPFLYLSFSPGGFPHK